MQVIDGRTLREWGFQPASWFKEGIATAQALRAAGRSDDEIRAELRRFEPVHMVPRGQPLPYGVFLEPENEIERANLGAVRTHMDEIMRLPTVERGAILPDACPSGAFVGTIPVGGAVAARDAIHPGFHSSDICCSVMLSVFDGRPEPKAALDAVHAVTHFGPGARKDAVSLPPAIERDIQANRFLRSVEPRMWRGHFATQGDGNHFAFVGRLASDGRTALVTHHGSRGLGAALYKIGMAEAQKQTRRLAPSLAGPNAWIVASSPEGEAYWEALQIVRAWTKASHEALHRMAAERLRVEIGRRVFNEHNFVFRRADGLYYHGKGATPSWSGFAPDDTGLTLIPLNMAEPVLVTEHRDVPEALGFAPHGAGRNQGRRALLRTGAPPAPEGVDARFFCGRPDPSEYPGAYKNAASVRAQIARFRLASIVDQVEPYGAIMAGDCEADAPWRKRKPA